MARAIDLVDRHPWRAFLCFGAVHAAVWTLAPWLLYPNLPLDMIEALTYGREWQLGSDKLPPLPWWAMEILYRLFHADIAYYAFSQLTVLAAFALVFRLALTTIGARAALASVLIIDGLHYFTSTAAQFNHNVIQLPFWALAGLSYYDALRSKRLMSWVLLGIAIGGAFWAKYFVVVLAAPLAVFLLIDRDARPALRTAGPYIAALVALVVAAPHLAWLVQNDFVPLHYVEQRASAPNTLLDYPWRPLRFALGQAGWLLPALAIAANLIIGRREAAVFDLDGFGRRILTLLAFGPAALLLTASALTGTNLEGMWGYPLWLFLGLWIALRAGPIGEPLRLIRLGRTWATVTAIYLVAFIIYMAVDPRIRPVYRAQLYPGAAVARELAARFHDETGTPVGYVIGSIFHAGNVGHYAVEAPRVVIDGQLGRTPWIDPVDLKRRGALVVWADGDPNRIPDNYRALTGDAVARQPLKFPAIWGQWVSTVGWTIVPPKS